MLSCDSIIALGAPSLKVPFSNGFFFYPRGIGFEASKSFNVLFDGCNDVKIPLSLLSWLLVLLTDITNAAPKVMNYTPLV